MKPNNGNPTLPWNSRRRRRHTTPPPNDSLLRWINTRNWNAAEAHLSQHPQDAKQQQPLPTTTEPTPLHVACMMKPPPSFLSSLISAHPTALRIQNDEAGYTPLHLTCWIGGPSLDVLQLLIEAYPEAVSIRSNDGWTPLHLACSRNEPIDMLRVLIRARPDAVLIPNRGGVTPLSLLWNKFAIDEDGDCILSRPWKRNDAEQQQLWEKELLMLKAAYFQRVDVDDYLLSSNGQPPPFRLIHALASLEDCPRSMMSHALSLHSSQTFETDQRGCLPLHIAAAAAASTAKTKGRDSIIDLLIQINPTSAKVPNAEGTLPLNLAIENRVSWEDGVKHIFEAAPDVLAVRDVKSHLYPFMIAASCEGVTLDCVFELLRHCPSLVQHGM